MFFQKSKPIHLGSKLTDEQNKELPAVYVFAHALKYLKQKIETFVSEKLHARFAEEICYILTCPAIWSEQSKLFMKTAAMHVSS